MNLNHYEDPENERKDDVINFIYSYNEEFSEFDYTIVKQCNKWLLDESEDKLEGIDAIQHYYEYLCDELVVVTDNNEVVACRFVEYDEEDEYMKNRVDDYQIGLNLTFALVDEEYRGQGLWNEMFQYVKNNILPRYSKADQLYLATSSENIPMKKAVESAGFEQVGFEEDDRGEGIHTLIYSYNIND